MNYNNNRSIRYVINFYPAPQYKENMKFVSWPLAHGEND